MSRVGGMVHYKAIEWPHSPSCQAAIIIFDQNGIVHLEVIDRNGRRYLVQSAAEWSPDRRLPEIPPTPGMWHERSHCRAG